MFPGGLPGLLVHVLEEFFGMDRAKATQVMLNVHTKVRRSAASSPVTWRKPRSPR